LARAVILRGLARAVILREVAGSTPADDALFNAWIPRLRAE
jgi:hypothetical protein